MEAFFRFGLRVFCDHGGHIAQKGLRVKVLFHHNGAADREVLDFEFVLQIIIMRLQTPSLKIQGGGLHIREFRGCQIGEERPRLRLSEA